MVNFIVKFIIQIYKLYNHARIAILKYFISKLMYNVSFSISLSGNKDDNKSSCSIIHHNQLNHSSDYTTQWRFRQESCSDPEHIRIKNTSRTIYEDKSFTQIR